MRRRGCRISFSCVHGSRARLASGSVSGTCTPELCSLRAGLGRGGARLETPSIGSIHGPRGPRQVSRTSTVRRRCAPLAPVHVTRCSSPRHGSSYRSTLPRPPPGSMSQMRTWEDASTDFCSCNLSRHEHLHERFDSRGGEPSDRSRPTTASVGTKAPTVHSSGCAIDVAPPASARSPTPLASSDEGSGAGCSWWDPRSRNPSDGAPRSRRCRPRTRRMTSL